MYEPPSTLRTLRLLAGLSLRRTFNRLTWGLKRKPAAAPGAGTAAPAPRKAAGRKRMIPPLVIVFLFLIMLFNSFIMSGNLLSSLMEKTSEAEGVTMLRVHPDMYSALEVMHDQHGLIPSASPAVSPPDHPTLHQHVLKYFQTQPNCDRLAGPLARQTEDSVEASGVEPLSSAEKLTNHFLRHGIHGFYSKRWLGGILYQFRPLPSQEAQIRGIITIILLLLLLSILFLGLSMGNVELGKTEWTLTWLYTFPIGARTLLTASLLEYAFINIAGVFFLLPLLLLLLLPVCHPAAATAGAAWMLVSLLGLIAGPRLLIETLARKHWKRTSVKNLQALCTVLYMASFFSVMMVTRPGGIPVIAARAAMAVSAVSDWLPIGMPMAVAHGRQPLAAALAAMPLCAIAIGWLCLRAGARSLQDGLIGSASLHAGSRGPATRAAWRFGGWLHGMTAKDWLLFRRDRTMQIQILLVPVFIIGLHVFSNPGAFGAGASFAQCAAYAYGMTAYAVMLGATNILNLETKTLWLLYSFPRRIDLLLREKIRFWRVSSLVVSGGFLLYAIHRRETVSALELWHCVYVLAGLVLFAHLSCGIGILSTDPLEPHPAKRIKPANLYLLMLLGATYTAGLFAPHVWTSIVMVILYAVLVYAVWQKVRDHAPFFLDPLTEPAPSISLSDGLICVVTYFVLQTLGILLCLRFVSIDIAVPLATAGAGALTALLSLYVFWRKGVRPLFASVGLWRQGGADWRTLLGLPAGIGLGGMLALCAMGYLLTLQWLGWDSLLNPEVTDGDPRETLLTMRGMFTLAVLIAPLTEEYLFRGIVYRGLRRSLSPAMAACASAAVFAIIHPPLAWLPVFALGVVTALLFERTRTLYAPAMCHVTYNLFVMLYHWQAGGQ